MKMILEMYNTGSVMMKMRAIKMMRTTMEKRENSYRMMMTVISE